MMQESKSADIYWLRRAAGHLGNQSMVEADARCIRQLSKWKLEQAGRFPDLAHLLRLRGAR